MSFMEPQADYFVAFRVETSAGSELVPADLVGDNPTTEDLLDYTEGDIQLDDDDKPDMTREEGWYARFSAPGYMDRTDWEGPYETEEAALYALAETFDVCPRCFEQCWEDNEPCREA